MFPEENISVEGNTCENVKVTPSNNSEPVIEVSISKDDDFLKQFSDKPFNVNPEEAKKKVKSFMNYIQSDRFKNTVNAVAYEKGVAPRELAHSFLGKAIGTIGDVLGIATNTIHVTVNGLLDLLNLVLKKSVDIIIGVANALIRIITFNQTARA